MPGADRRPGAPPTTPRRGSPGLRRDHPPRRLVRCPRILGRLTGVGLDDQAVDFGLAVIRQVLLQCLADQLGPRPPFLSAEAVDALQEVVGQLHECLRPGHRPYGSHMMELVRREGATDEPLWCPREV